jgi:cellulose synthase/poly-beta-1,6-N-acetylglucosamine synthase-like glycosyltransferase
MIVDGVLLFFFFFGAVCFYFGLVSLAYYPLALTYPFWERRLLRRARAQRYTPSVSVLVPAYNEEQTIAAALQSMLASDYPDFEVIVINDGSTDRTAAEVEPFLVDARVRYLKKENGGKALALNLGLAEARGEIVLFTDADSLFEPDTIRNGVAYFIDPSIGAVSGNDTVLVPHGPMQKMLVITSHIGTGFVRRSLSLLGVLQIISGNLGLVRTDILRRVGGFRPVWGEDLEVTLRLKRHGVRVVYGASTRVLAECPSTIRGLWKQRVRWLRSYIKILGMHRDMIGNPRYGWFGPYLAFNAVNMIAVPLAQVLALLLLPIAWWQGQFSLYGWEWVAYLGFGFLVAAAVVSILLDKTPRDLLYLPYAALLVLFSHFYNAVVLYSLWAEARTHEEAWNKLERRDVRALAAVSRVSWVRFAVVLMTVVVVTGALGYWLGMRAGRAPEDSASGQTAQVPLARQHGTTAVAIHFDAWRNWRDAYESLLAIPEARYVNRVAVSAGRADWTYFRWPGNEQWWSPTQTAADTDMLEHALAALNRRGYRTTAILDVFATRYIERHPAAAAVDNEGKRSKEIVCSTELAEGAAGNHLVSAAEALALTTQADTVAVTELFYDKHCYDDRCLVAFRKATGRADWPRTATSRIDYRDPAIGAWRSRQVASVAARLAQGIHAHGKKFALDVKVSRGDVMRNSVENGQDYHLLAPHVDEFVVWDYFAIEGEPPERSAHVAAYLDDEFGADKFYLSIGLWDRFGYISAAELARALRSAQEGGATQLWITPAKQMAASHWKALAEAVRAANPGADAASDTLQGASLSVR